MKRIFTFDGVEWVAWTSGGGAYGTGNRGLGNVEAVHFARASEPEAPLMEALVGAGRFDDLFDAELLEIFRGARKIVDPSNAPRRPPGRRTLSG